MITLNSFKVAHNFMLSEFACDCCNHVMLDSRLVQLLQRLRSKIQAKIYINSGFRCETENRKVLGTKNSYHLLGMAVDISAPEYEVRKLASIAEEIGFKGIGIYEDRGFVHLDIRPFKVIWED